MERRALMLKAATTRPDPRLSMLMAPASLPPRKPRWLCLAALFCACPWSTAPRPLAVVTKPQRFSSLSTHHWAIHPQRRYSFSTTRFVVPLQSPTCVTRAAAWSRLSAAATNACSLSCTSAFTAEDPLHSAASPWEKLYAAYAATASKTECGLYHVTQRWPTRRSSSTAQPTSA